MKFMGLAIQGASFVWRAVGSSSWEREDQVKDKEEDVLANRETVACRAGWAGLWLCLWL